jgi:hypothetical protein
MAANAAGAVDLADDALTEPRLRAVLHDAHELVARDAFERHISRRQLDVGVANAGVPDLDYDFVAFRRGLRVRRV